MSKEGIRTTALLSGATATGAGAGKSGVAAVKTYQATGAVSSGTGSATVAVQGTNNGGVTYDQIGTITLTLGTASTSESFTSDDRYQQVRGNVTAISGTGASVSLTMGY